MLLRLESDSEPNKNVVENFLKFSTVTDTPKYEQQNESYAF
jgi:hypothetical protein